jgi:orotate phosphoribosyltransferase
VKDILQMGREEILALDPNSIDRLFTPEEVIHIAKILNAFWQYDYQAAKDGRPGLHAELKSGKHSDGFFVSRIMLAEPNVLENMAHQLAMKVRESISVDNIRIPGYLAGIPAGATPIGKKLAQIIGAKPAEMDKVNGHIKLITQLPPDTTIIVVEDFITRGTGMAEAIQEIKRCQPKVNIYHFIPAIINRGGITEKHIIGTGTVYPLPIANIRINDWEPEDCPLCKMGSTAIKPKATDENWWKITHSQI